MTFRSTGKYDLVICDIDGCLSPESHAPINIAGLSKIAEHNRLAIQDCDRPVVTLCSGRPIGFVECLCRLIQNTLIPCIGENGVWLWRPNDNSFECDPAITDQHLEVVHEARKLLRSLFQAKRGDSATGEVSIGGVVPSRYRFSPVNRVHDCRRVSETGLADPSFDDVALHQLRPSARQQGDCDRSTADSNGNTTERIAGIGDTMGDRFIAERVSWFGCPANAEAEIKKAATYVSPHDEVEGVLDLLDRLNR